MYTAEKYRNVNGESLRGWKPFFRHVFGLYEEVEHIESEECTWKNGCVF
jgi:hypothetical protein